MSDAFTPSPEPAAIPLGPPRWAFWVAPLLLLMTLGTGILLGVVLERRWLGRRPVHRSGALPGAFMPGPPPGPGGPLGAGPRGEGPGMRGPGGPPGSETPGQVQEREERMRHWMLERLQRELSLTPSQRNAIDKVLAEQGRQFIAIQQEVRPRMDALLTTTRARIDSLLTDEQREEFRKRDGL